MNYIEEIKPITEKTYNKLTRPGQAFKDLMSWIECLNDPSEGHTYKIFQESRSLVFLRPESEFDNFDWEVCLQMLKVKCPTCGKLFADMTYQDPCGAGSECPHCNDELEY